MGERDPGASRRRLLPSKTVLFVASLCVGVLFFLTSPAGGFTPSGWRVLGLLVPIVTVWATEAVPVGVGAMAAILGMDLDAVTEVCRDAAQGEVCEPANINSGEQIVISGHTAAVERGAKLADERGAKRAKVLPVSAPFHCSLMKPAQDRLAPDLRKLPFLRPGIPLASNVDAALVEDANGSRDALIRQVTRPVQWEPSMRLLLAQGVATFVEIGPGKVLCGLLRQIDRSKTGFNVEDEASLQKTFKHLAVPA